MRARRRPSTIRTALIGLLLGLALGLLLGYELGRMAGPGKAALEILMVYGSEKQAWIEAVVPEFEREYEERTGTPIRVICVPMGSGESMYQIILGQLKPVVWSPACSLWIPLANKLWAEEHPGSGPLVPEGAWHPLVSSPLVIITWASLQESWHLTSLRDLRELATSERGHEVRFAHTDPSLSNSGLMSIMLELVAAIKALYPPGKEPPELTVKDMEDPAVKDWIRGLEARAVAYPSSTGWLVGDMVSSGPGKINVVLAYENLVILENQAAGKELLVAIYPEEGLLMSDHPFCILNAPWVSPEQREAARALLAYLLRADVQAKAMRYGFRPVNESVELDTTIFSPEWGVLPDPPVRVLSTEVSGDVVLLLPDLWMACRP